MGVLFKDSCIVLEKMAGPSLKIVASNISLGEQKSTERLTRAFIVSLLNCKTFLSQQSRSWSRGGSLCRYQQPCVQETPITMDFSAPVLEAVELHSVVFFELPPHLWEFLLEVLWQPKDGGTTSTSFFSSSTSCLIGWGISSASTSPIWEKRILPSDSSFSLMLKWIGEMQFLLHHYQWFLFRTFSLLTFVGLFFFQVLHHFFF